MRRQVAFLLRLRLRLRLQRHAQSRRQCGRRQRLRAHTRRAWALLRRAAAASTTCCCTCRLTSGTAATSSSTRTPCIPCIPCIATAARLIGRRHARVLQHQFDAAAAHSQVC